MPLYTYITTFKGATHVLQKRTSNFKGFPAWLQELPAKALPELTPALRKEVNPYAGTFEAIPNQEHVWRKVLVVAGSELTVVVVESRK